MQETLVQSLGCKDPLEEGMATLSSILAQRIPWTEEHGGLQSTGSQRVRCDWATEHTSTQKARSYRITLGTIFNILWLNHNGKEYGKEYMQTCNESLCCTPEINTTLYINYAPIKFLKRKSRALLLSGPNLKQWSLSCCLPSLAPSPHPLKSPVTWILIYQYPLSPSASPYSNCCQLISGCSSNLHSCRQPLSGPLTQFPCAAKSDIESHIAFR